MSTHEFETSNYYYTYTSCVGISIDSLSEKYRREGREKVMTTDHIIKPGFSKAVSVVIRSVNIVCEPTVFGSSLLTF
jgi:hypothetical protein